MFSTAIDHNMCGTEMLKHPICVRVVVISVSLNNDLVWCDVCVEWPFYDDENWLPKWAAPKPKGSFDDLK